MDARQATRSCTCPTVHALPMTYLSFIPGDLLRVDGHARGGEAQHSLAVTERTAERAEEAVRRRCTSTLLKQGIASLVVLLCAESG